MTDTFRLHGRSPYKVVVLHGGPGALGSAYGLARLLSEKAGVLEPYQTHGSIAGLIDELKETIHAQGSPPVVLIGHSWGAWLAGLFASKHPDLVKRIVLLGSGPLDESHAKRIHETRLKRMTEEDGAFYRSILKGKFPGGRTEALKRLGDITSKTDAFEPLPEVVASEIVEFRPELYDAIWREASDMRKSERLLEEFARVQCPITVIHGDWDPHPAAGVEEPLSRAAETVDFHLLKDCGHEPWREKKAKDEFFKIMKPLLE